MHTWPRRCSPLVALLCAVTAAWGQATDTLETTYKALERVPGSETRLLHTGDRETYQVRPDVYDRYRALFLTIRRDDPIRIEVGSGSALVSITKSRRSDPTPTDSDGAFEQQLRELSRGDIIELNGKVYRLLSVGEADVTLAPRLPGTNPPEYDGRTRIAYDQIKFMNILEAKEPEPGQVETGGVHDVLTREGISSGDTVIVRMLPGAGPGSVRGRVVALARNQVRVQTWRGAGYDRMIDLPRADVRLVERAVMEGRRTIPVGELSVVWTERRYVERRGNKAEFSVVLQHDEPGRVLVGLWLRPLSPEGDPLPSGGAAVRPMFPGMPRAVELAEGDLASSLGISQEGLSSIESSGPEAEMLLVEAIAEAREPDILRALLLAATQSGNPRLLAYAVSRAATSSDKDPVRAIALEALGKAPEAAARYVDDALALEDEQLRVTIIKDMELQSAMLPSGMRALPFRGRLIGLYSALPDVLDRARAERLFEFSLRDDSLLAPLAQAYGVKPAAALPLLVDTYLDPEVTSDRKQLARSVLVEMGPSGVDALSAELVRRGVDTRPVGEAVEARKPLVDQVELGFKLAKLEAMNAVVLQARALLDRGELEDAHETLRPVLVAFHDHAAARALLEELRLPLARTYISTRRRSDAMRLLRDAKSQEARTRLGVLYLEAASEELTGVVVRDEPHVAAQNMGLLDRHQTLPGRQVDTDWVEVSFTVDRKGYVRSTCMDNAGGNFTVRVVFLPVPAFEDLLESAKAFAPELEPQCQDLLGRRYLQEAVQSYEDEDYARSLPLFAKARPLVPEDDRLSLERIAWFRAYWWLFAGFAGLVVIAIVTYFLANHLRRRRKIDLSKGAPLEIKTESGRIVQPKTKKQAPAGSREGWTSPVFLVKVAVALTLAGVIGQQAWKLWRAF